MKETIGYEGIDIHDDSYDCWTLEYKRKKEVAICECGYEKCQPRHSWGPGCRQFYIMHFVIKGEGKLTIDGKETYSICQNQIFLNSPGKKYYYEADETNPWEYVWIGFFGTRVDSILNAIDLSKDCIFSIPTDESVKDWFLSVLNSYQATKTVEIKSEAYCNLILSWLIEHYPRYSNDKKLLETRDFCDILRYIKVNYSTANVATLVKLFYYERSNIYKLFKKNLGISPSEYLERHKLYCAVRLMETTQMTLTQIASQVGYNNYNWFFLVFKRRFGFSPELYRKLSKKEKRKCLDEFEIVEKAMNILSSMDI